MNIQYDRIGINYNYARSADPYLLKQFESMLNMNASGTYLDIGCGTGNYSIGLFGKCAALIGIDPSRKMLDQLKARQPRINWILGTAENIALQNNIIDGVFGCMTIHHWSNLSTGFSEIKRVLKCSCPLVLFTSSAEQMKNYWLNHYFPKMMRDSINQMPSIMEIVSSLMESGFRVMEKVLYNVSDDLEDKFLYCGKNNPKIYLDESIRKGISSFASLAFKSEVRSGLLQLQADIKSQEINKIMAQYKNELGDYFFIRADKSDE